MDYFPPADNPLPLPLEGLCQQVLEAFQPLNLPPDQVSTEIRYLVEDVLEVSWASRVSDPQQLVHSKHLARLNSLLKKRLQERVPLQYLLGKSTFYGLVLKVTPDVLIPRPETERLVEVAWELMSQSPQQAVADIGTGSGAIILALKWLAQKHKRPFQAIATDISPQALAVARDNAEALGFSDDHLTFVCGDSLSALDEHSSAPLSLIVSNPPYIAESLKPTLAKEVLAHEPHLALFGQHNGLAHYEHYAQTAQHYLRPGGWLVVEFGTEMARPIMRLFEAHGWQNIEIVPDYGGQPRILKARKPLALEHPPSFKRSPGPGNCR